MRVGLCIAGPTASGKSAFALRVAAKLREPLIINCDSMQVYRDLSILTARPDQDALAAVPHRLYGYRDGALAYSVAQWRDDVRAVLDREPERVPIFVGGTGLYFKVLLEGIAPMPPVDPAIRETVRHRCATEGPAVLHSELDEPMQMQLSPTDSQRVSRALEVQQSTGKSLAYWQAQPSDGGLIDVSGSSLCVLAPDRGWLDARIEKRAQTMLSQASLDEVRALIARALPDDMPIMRALGVAALASYLRGDVDRETALARLITETRRYAKRQSTWFRGQMPDWTRIDPRSDEDLGRMADELAAGLKESVVS